MREYSARELRDRIAGRETSSVEATEAVFERIGKRDPVIGAYISTDREAAMRKAAEVDRRIAAGEQVGQLAGVPVAVKDNMCTRWGATTCASRILENFHSPYNATVVERLLAAEPGLVGKTNMCAFAVRR